MLTARTTETEHQGGETALDIAIHVMVCQLIDTLQERQNLTIILQESDHWLIQSRKFLVRFISTWVVSTSAVENITAAIS